MFKRLFLYLFFSINLCAANNEIESLREYKVIRFDPLSNEMRKQLYIMAQESPDIENFLNFYIKLKKTPSAERNVDIFIYQSIDKPQKTYGFIVCEYDIDEEFVGFILTVAIHKNFRNKGIAQILLHEVETSCKARNMKAIKLGVRSDNHQAIRAYRKFGFKKDKRVGMIKIIDDLIEENLSIDDLFLNIQER